MGKQTIQEVISKSKNRIESEIRETNGSRIFLSTLGESVQVSLDFTIS